ncbi:MAG: preprotein translocase subunit YajC [bacterium]|jgi:preprotein translocase subunit YajC|nr:preprotein translocase subunit YajC [Candidatus Neomarinimicrobiota bacterium]HIL86919.1 preprotein translocase subunit YajC [Candidatus Neomarinimicrobiota bacterium]
MITNKLIFQESEASFFDVFLAQLPIFLIFLVLYYFILRPNNKKQANVKTLQENLKKGDSIVTIGGIHGKIIQVRSNKATLRVSNNNELTVDVTAVARLKNSENKE